jgi:hypothetical protein
MIDWRRRSQAIRRHRRDGRHRKTECAAAYLLNGAEILPCVRTSLRFAPRRRS